MDRARVRVRPIRLAFLVSPEDTAALLKVFQLNSSLWGGVYNFVIPVFERVPKRYRGQFQPTASAIEMRRGLLEAFQPDFLVEVTPGSADGLGFASDRVVPFRELFGSDSSGRRSIGVDLRSVCRDLYQSTYKYVLRHPPSFLIASSKARRFELFFAAVFGSIPDTTEFKTIADTYLGTLDGKREAFEPVDFPRLFEPQYVHPLNVGTNETRVHSQNQIFDARMFYLDEASPYDLIDFWNLRAIGWVIRPLPASLAPRLTDYCERFVAKVYRPFRAPSQGFHAASFLCSPTQDMGALQEYVKQLARPAPDAITLDPRVPRLWEDWGRGADQARPQLITSMESDIDIDAIGETLNVRGTIPTFLQADVIASESRACANILESAPLGAPVIPWQTNALTSLLQELGEEHIWASREGITFCSGTMSNSRFLLTPSPFNVFSAYFQHLGYKIAISPSGRTCQQIISSLGDIYSLGVVMRSGEILRFLDQMAHEDVEIEFKHEGGTGKKRRIKKAYAPYPRLREVVQRSNQYPNLVDSHVDALLRCNVLKLGMALRCGECSHTSWFSLEETKPTLTCPRCMASFPFPSGAPPRDAWAYKVSGPFAAENFAHGAYCVAAALRFFLKDRRRSMTWIPSFEMKAESGEALEADFGAFLAPGRFDLDTAPYLILGECKSFNRLEPQDFKRARALANAFPGAALCFATFNEKFSPQEISSLKRIAIRGRRSYRTGRVQNPVILLTARELFGQFKRGNIHSLYDSKEQMARGMFMRGNLQELADFTQQLYLGLPSYGEWRDQKKKRTRQTLSIIDQPLS